MGRPQAILVLFVAALLEAGGDAIIRAALRGSPGVLRIALFVFGGIVLFAYGWTVNAPAWDFGRLLGIYVVFFFITAQLISWLVFHQPPNRGVLIGGSLIVAGGFVIAFLDV